MNLPDFFSISYKFFRKSGFIRAHHRTKGFWTNVCRLSHKRRKGLCLTPKQQFSLMRQGPFLLCLCQRGAFTGFWRFFFSLFPCAGSGKPCMTAHSINGTSRHSRQTNREEWFYPSDQTRLAKQIKTYFLADGLPGFTLPAMFFSVGDVFFTDFSFEVFLSNLPLLPFTSIFAPFSEPHQAVIFVLGAKVTPGLYGKARSSLLFSGKISSPSGSIFPKNLAFPNPYLFRHPKRKRPMRQKDALKKCRINERQIR